MVRNTKKKALYEVIRQAGLKTNYEQLHSRGAGAGPAGEQQAHSTGSGQGGEVVPPNVVRWARKPSVVQFNAGRIEFSMPYQLGIAVLLGAILVVVLAFRLGERVGGRETKNPQAGLPGQRTAETGGANRATPVPVATKQASSGQAHSTSSGQAGVVVKQATPTTVTTGAAKQDAATIGRNRIVIQMYQVRSHLEPAKEYFDRMGVATEIIEKNNWYYLVTKNRYDNIDKSGSEGFLAKQKVIELGAGYKAPPGFETFGPKPFSDAFGMRFEE